jgi:hypothetical protein
MIRKIALAAAPLAALGGLMFSAGAAHAATVQYANGVANGTGATASFGNGTWTLDSGHGPGGSAQIDLVSPATATAEPTMTVDHQGAGNPRWVIEFHNGTYLFGYPAAGDNASKLSWTLEPSGKAEPDYATALKDAQAGGADDQVTAAFIVEDTGNPDTTVNLTNVTYNGEAVVQYVAPPPPAAKPYLYGGHAVDIAPTRENVYFSLGGVKTPTWVHFQIFGPGPIDGHQGWVLAQPGENVGVYTGLEANHTYVSFYTPVTGRGSTTQIPGSHGGHVTFVSNQG